MTLGKSLALDRGPIRARGDLAEPFRYRQRIRRFPRQPSEPGWRTPSTRASRSSRASRSDQPPASRARRLGWHARPHLSAERPGSVHEPSASAAAGFGLRRARPGDGSAPLPHARAQPAGRLAASAGYRYRTRSSEEYLGHGERMIYNDHPSFQAFVIEHILLVLGLFVAAGLFVGVVLNGSLTAILLTFLVMAIVLLVLVLIRLSERYTSYVITNVRIMRVSGILTRRVHSIPWMRVTDLTFDQTWLGRVLGYATLHIESANEEGGLRDLVGVSQSDAVQQVPGRHGRGQAGPDRPRLGGAGPGRTPRVGLAAAGRPARPRSGDQAPPPRAAGDRVRARGARRAPADPGQGPGALAPVGPRRRPDPLRQPGWDEGRPTHPPARGRGSRGGSRAAPRVRPTGNAATTRRGRLASIRCARSPNRACPGAAPASDLRSGERPLVEVGQPLAGVDVLVDQALHDLGRPLDAVHHAPPPDRPG